MRRALILVLVAVVSGVAAYVVNAGSRSNAAPAAVQQAARPDGAPALQRFADCLSRYGVQLPRPGQGREGFGGDVRAAFAACRQYLPAQPFRGGGHFGLR